MPRHCLNSCSKARFGSANAVADDTSPHAYAAQHGGHLRLVDAFDDATRDLVQHAWAEDVAQFNFTFAEAVANDE